MIPVAEPTLATRLAEWVDSLDYEQLPARAVEVAKLLVLDQLGLQIRGATLPNVAPERRLVAAMRAAPQSTVVGSGTRTVAPYAAYVNATLACSCEFDDAHMHASHPGSYVVPTALAFAESVGASGREVITAVVAGVQVMALLGAPARANMMRAGWEPAKVLGTFGATATAGTLLGLTAAEIANAFGIAGSDASGTMEYGISGGDVKRMCSGSAARSGSQAALLAKDGLTGPLTIMEGQHGLFRMFGDTGDLSVIDEVWDHFHIVDTMFRMYPAVGSAGPVLDAVRHLVRQHDVRWRDIREIRLGLPDFAIAHGGMVTRPTDAVSAQFSTAFSVALMLVRGGNRPEDYLNPALWTDPDLLSVVDKVVPYLEVFVPEQPALSCQLDIELADGRVLSHRQRGFRGYPSGPDTDDGDVRIKFLDNVDRIVGAPAARKMVELAAELDSLDDLTELMALTSRPLSAD
jgi:2-methylcitrate dehydratase PrpD